MSDNVELENLERTQKEAEKPEASSSEDAQRLETMAAMQRVPVKVRVVVGSTKMAVSEVLQLSRGAVIEVNKRVGEPVDIMINDRIVARGELVIVEDERLGVTLTEIVKDSGWSSE